MRVRITLTNGEHLTGDLYAVDVWHDHTDAVKHASVAEIEVLEVEALHTVETVTATTYYLGDEDR